MSIRNVCRREEEEEERVGSRHEQRWTVSTWPGETQLASYNVAILQDPARKIQTTLHLPGKVNLTETERISKHVFQKLEELQ